MEKVSILKGAIVLLIAAVMILSTVSVTANTKTFIPENSVQVKSITKSMNRDVLFEDDFESYDDFVLDFPPWTQYDGDGFGTWVFQDNDFENEYYVGAFIEKHDKNKMLNAESINGTYTYLEQVTTSTQTEEGIINDYFFLHDYQQYLQESRFAPGEIIVKFKEDVPVSGHRNSEEGFIKTGIHSIDVLNERYGVTAIESMYPNRSKMDDPYGFSNVYKFLLSDDSDIFTVVTDYKEDPNVIYAEPNYMYQTSTFPNDPFCDVQWALHNVGQTGGTVDADIDAPEAWDIETGDSDVIIAVVDTGVDYTHPDLVDNIWNNVDEIPYNNIDDDGNGFVDDIHGTSFIEEEINAYGKPDSFQRYGLWKDESETWHLRFMTSTSKRFFGTLWTDDVFYDVTPVNLSSDEYSITSGNISFDVIKSPIEAGFDFRVMGTVLNVDLYFQRYSGGFWMTIWGPMVTIGSDMVEVRPPYMYYITQSPLDDTGHGTHCAGIASAVTNNALGIAGVCWNCTIMPIKAINNQGYGYEDDLVNAIVYAVDNGADVISMSWGSYQYSQHLEEVLEYAYDQDVALVAAARNDNTWMPSYPAAYEKVIGVAATDEYDHKASFSNYGYWVDVAAPGVNIFATLPTYTTLLFQEDYGIGNGTSMACPHVAGVAALIASKNDCGSLPDIVKTLVRNTADPVDSPVYIGEGRLNAFEAVNRSPAVAVLDRTLDGNEVNGSFDISGGAWGDCFFAYVIDYGHGKNPSDWVELTNSSEPLQYGVLASLDSTLLPEGFYTIRLQLICTDGVYRDTISVIVHNYENTFIVDDDGGPGVDHRSIQAAVDDAGTGDTVYVHRGWYNESVLVERTISLLGEQRNATIIDANYIDPLYHYNGVVVLEAPSILLSGFTIRHGLAGVWVKSHGNNIAGNMITDTLYAPVYLYGANSNIVVENIIRNSSYYGISLYASDDNHISDTSITGASYAGIAMGYSSFNTISENSISFTRVLTPHGYTGEGISVGLYSCSNTISNNTLSHNTHSGVLIASPATRNIVYHNTISDNELGVWLYSFDDEDGMNTISQNTIRNNERGIYVAGLSTNYIFDNLVINNDYGAWAQEADNNMIYHNNFVGNLQHGFDRDDNIWDNGYPSGGNYWDDYTGNDTFSGPEQDIPGSDGLGDIPYDIDGGDNPDQYPLMIPWGITPGDLDFDGDVDLIDLVQLLSHYGTTEGATYAMGDLDGDHDVDLSDLAALLANYGHR